MKVIIFEDEVWRQFAPLIYTRPIFEIRCGAFTLYERVARFLDQHRYGTSPNIGGLCRSYLMPCYGPSEGRGSFLSESTPLILINGRTIHLDWLPALLEAPQNTVYISNGILLAANLSPSLASAVLYYLYEQRASDALDELQRFAHIKEVDTKLLAFPWDLINEAGEQVVRDTPLLTARVPRYTKAEALVTLRNSDHVYVAPSAQLDGPIVLDARDGPIFIDEDAHIEPFSFIQGPTYIGRKTLISSALVRGETSIGPVCRIGGEVEASTIQGFSNKHHDGFLGHSWLGEWVNIGAMTTNSDLKNTYGSVKVTIEGIGDFDSGTLKLGVFLADHVKLGIGLHLTGGSVIGTASNIYGIHMVPKNVPPFTWGGEIFREFRIDSMINVAQKVMGRRKQELTPAYESMLRDVFALTRANRGILDAPIVQPMLVQGTGNGGVRQLSMN